MTAEISISNKHAVALAADSAVTIGGGQKVFTSVNKIFCLSEEHPVGFMIYGGASFLGISWEMVIGAYRKKIGKKTFSTFEEYGADFIKFLVSSPDLFPIAQQEAEFEFLTKNYLFLFMREIEEKAKELHSKHGSITDDDIKTLLNKTLDSHFSSWDSATFIKKANAKKFNALLRKKNTFFNKQIKIVLGKLPVTLTQKVKLKKIFVSIPFKQRFNNMRVSGIVLAGFGDKEYFSSIIGYEIETMVDNTLKYKVDLSHIDHSNDAQIRAFAQKEMVQAFIEGIHPDLEKKIKMEIGKAFHALPAVAVDQATGLSVKKKIALKKEINKKTTEFYRVYMQNLQRYQYENFISKMLGMVGVLPKDELAMVAESLVNLTSFKRRISMGTETVGGPIDVAIISKNEGFMWVKRKTYSSPDLNDKKI